MKKTFSPTPSDIKRSWKLFDAKGQILGRLSTQIANILMAKHKVVQSRHFDMADHVVVINAKEIKVTGKKFTQKLYRRHSGYPGGMVVKTFEQVMAKDPTKIIRQAVKGMLPDNKLQDRLLTHLHIYENSSHPYQKQFSKTTNNG